MALPTREMIYEEHPLEYFLYTFDDKKRILNINTILYDGVCEFANGLILPLVSDGKDCEQCLMYSAEHYFNDAYYICTKLSFDTHPESHFLEEYFNTIEGGALDKWMVFSLVYWLLARNYAIRPQHINMMKTIAEFLLDGRDVFITSFFISLEREKKMLCNFEVFPAKQSYQTKDDDFRVPIVRIGKNANEAEERIYEDWCESVKYYDLLFAVKALSYPLEDYLEKMDEKKGSNKNNKTKKDEGEKSIFIPTGKTFSKTAKITDLQLTLIMQRLTATNKLDPNTSADDWSNLFSGADCMFTMKWLGKPGELRDLFKLLTDALPNSKTGYVTPEYGYQKIVRSHFTDKDGNYFKELKGQKSIPSFKPILDDCSLFLQRFTEHVSKGMREILMKHRDELEEQGYGVISAKRDDNLRIQTKK